MYKKNQEILIKITATSSDGNGIGHHDDMVVFVVGAIVGDYVRAHIIKVSKKYLVAKVVEIIEESKFRIKSNCAVSVSCGGCVYRNLNYKEELKIKKSSVYDCIKRIGKIDLKPNPIIYGERDYYRNKASYPVNQNLEFGFYAGKTHRIIPNKSCVATPPLFEKVLNIIQDFCLKNKISAYNEETNSGLLRHVVLRYGEVYNELMITLVVNGDNLHNSDELITSLSTELKDSFKSLYLNVNTKNTNVIFGDKVIKLHGEDTIKDKILDLDFMISPLSFYQVNRKMTEKLYSKVIEYANAKDKTVFDLYCGTGTIGLNLAKFAQKVVGVEIIPDAIKDAKINAKLNNIHNCEFICGDALKISLNINEKPDIIVLDPPRKGAEKDLLERIANYYSPERIVYVSCDPATLARDVEILSKYGYKLIEYTPVNMFPATKHVETVALIIKNN